MAKKQTKRQRKFQATGGVQKRLEKGGTISSKRKSSGKRDNSNGKSTSSQPRTDDNRIDAVIQQKSADDFMGNDNLGNLDVDTFFAQFAEQGNDIDNDDGEEEEEEDDDDENNVSAMNLEEKEVVEEEEDDDDKVEDDDENDGSEDEDDDEGDDDDIEINDEHSDLEDEEDIEKMEAQMKQQMKRMQTSDPEFHTFLKENEESLLDYNDNEDDQDEDEKEDDEENEKEEHEANTNEKPDASTIKPQLTDELLQTVVHNTFQNHSMKSLKKLLNIYKSACYVINMDSSTTSKSSSNNNNNIGEAKKQQQQQPYSIDPSSKLYDEIMTICLQQLHVEFQYHILGPTETSKEGDDDDDDDDDDDHTNEKSTDKSKSSAKDDDEAEWKKTLHPKVMERSEQWNDMKQVLLSFYRSTLHLLMEVKDLEFLAVICQSIKYYIRYLTPFPRISELMLKTFTNLWSAPIDTIENYQIVRLNAFLRIRQLALLQPFPFIEECLKKTYLAYMKRAKFGTVSIHSPTLPTLTFMGNCLVELYNIDYHSSYQHAFVYIRQLALLLRGVMQKKTIEAMQQVYCWQYIYCLKLWVAVLSSAAQQENEDHGKVDMKSLIFPLIEVILGTIRLIPSPVRHLPYRCHCVRFLHQLAASTELFIPTTSILLDCFDWKEFTLVPKKTKESNRASTRGVQLSMMIKFGKDDSLRSHNQLEASMNELFLLLNREIDMYRYSPGFPEYAIRIIVRLRQFNKEIRNARWKTYVKASIELCDTYTLYAVQGRCKLQQAPRDVQQLECLKPMGEKSMYERYSDSIRKEQVTLDAINGVSSAAAAAAKKSKKRSTVETDRNDDDDDDDEENNEDAATANKKKRKKKKKKAAGTAAKSMEELQKDMMENDQVMETVDQVQEGIDWSEDDNDDDE